jgi:hypothetical protein
VCHRFRFRFYVARKLFSALFQFPDRTSRKGETFTIGSYKVYSLSLLSPAAKKTKQKKPAKRLNFSRRNIAIYLRERLFGLFQRRRSEIRVDLDFFQVPLKKFNFANCAIE